MRAYDTYDDDSTPGVPESGIAADQMNNQDDIGLTEEEFWLKFYNLNVEEFRKLSEVAGFPAPLPELWSEGREFPAGMRDWDIVVDAIHQLQRTLYRGLYHAS